MPKGLSYADAVKILGGQGPAARAIDNLLGGALSLATLGGSEAALGFFDAKTEILRLGGLLTARLNDSMSGLKRYDRSQRLLAAHCVLVVAAFFESVDEILVAGSSERTGFTTEEEITRLGAPPGESTVYRLLSAKIPLPSADRTYDSLLAELDRWYRSQATALSLVLPRVSGAARLPEWAVDRYDRSHRRLAEEIPEFAIWAGRLEDRAAARGLERLESALRRAGSGRDPGADRAALAGAYRAELERPVLGGEPGDVVLPTLGEAYIDPHFRVQAAGPGARPSAEEWWTAEVRTDFPAFLAAYLTTDRPTEAPLLVLGQPGAGKSALTRILAARLPAADFLVVRVPLRDVPAETDILDQVEWSLRAAIGRAVEWAALAGDALPVVLLDGFDELLQATGVHQSNYLERVAEFQRREAAVGRPVVVLVTSRIAVADRARLPDGGLVVRLEPFDDAQIARWAAVWNTANRDRLRDSGRDPLDPAVLIRFRDLAGQPLLLLMLALYDASGNALRHDAASLDSGQLYERLLARFALREVDRVHAGLPDHRRAELVEDELVRLSVVAFAMFNRNRLWISERELDADLAGLDLAPSPSASADHFRTPLTAAQDMVGRFFFIQRSQAIRDDKLLQTYEFLHATFGEYLIARLLVHALREVIAHEQVGTRGPRLSRRLPGDLIQTLLGYTPLTARNTVLFFVGGLIRNDERGAFRASLLRRASESVTRPAYTPGPYRPVDKRIDHWMATYSFNVVLLTLACGGELRASELFTGAKDPADWLRGTALQWRAAIPGTMWLESLNSLWVRRDWHGGRRDMVLSLGQADVLFVDTDWSHRVVPGSPPRPEFQANFALVPALTSMSLSNNLSDDTFLHALEPLLYEVPEAITTFVRHPDITGTESVAHSLLRMWMASASNADRSHLIAEYRRAANAVSAGALVDRERCTTILVRSLVADAPRLSPMDVLAIIDQSVLDHDAPGIELVLEYVLSTAAAGLGGERDRTAFRLFAGALPILTDEDLLGRLLHDILAMPESSLSPEDLGALAQHPSGAPRLSRFLHDHPELVALPRAASLRRLLDSALSGKPGEVSP
ncbi:NACHT domain-containing protein [Actinoplanes subtropicus]|uniref:NACHT domain-containing protein n=1 Tax=Actinoplanes subtropicus TaxID=543632 RepID=UPI0006919EB7|nr:ATP-binding protein [Actinoplanes subtropicus]